MLPYTYITSVLKSIDVRDVYIFDVMSMKVMLRGQKTTLFISSKGK